MCDTCVGIMLGTMNPAKRKRWIKLMGKQPIKKNEINEYIKATYNDKKRGSND